MNRRNFLTRAGTAAAGALGVLAVPGTGFGRPGYVRLTLTVPEDCIVRSLPSFAKALHG